MDKRTCGCRSVDGCLHFSDQQFAEIKRVGKRNKVEYDRVYYWTGGTDNGKWNEAIPNCYPDNKDIDTLLADVQRMGYKAVKGSSKIGAPEGFSFPICTD